MYRKYHNKKTVIDGIKFDSKLEAERYAQLKMMDHSGRMAKHGAEPCIKPISGTF